MIPISTDMLNGTYLLAILVVASLALWPEETTAVLTSCSLKIQVYWTNWRMKRYARKLHRQLAADMKNHFGVDDFPPFEWTDLWDR